MGRGKGLGRNYDASEVSSLACNPLSFHNLIFRLFSPTPSRAPPAHQKQNSTPTQSTTCAPETPFREIIPPISHSPNFLARTNPLFTPIITPISRDLREGEELKTRGNRENRISGGRTKFFEGMGGFKRSETSEHHCSGISHLPVSAGRLSAGPTGRAGDLHGDCPRRR